MKFYEEYNRVLNLPTPTALAAALGVAALLVFAGLVISFGRFRWTSRVMSALGLVLMMLVLLAFRHQTVTHKVSDIVTATRPRYSERARLYAGAALLGIPIVTAIGALSIYLANRRRLRAQVPRHMKAGRKHFIQQEFEAALHEYNVAVNFAPHLGEAYFRRGCTHRVLGQNELAMDDFNQAIERDPRLATAFLERGKLRTEIGDLDGALADFQHLMIIRGNDPEFYLNRGICMMKKGVTSEAIADFERVLKLTNHSDFAEPAKRYLQQCEGHADSSSPPAITNANPGANGPTAPPHQSKPAAQDYFL
jgi:tetratricopeptide (TPR) repeat protein